MSAIIIIIYYYSRGRPAYNRKCWSGFKIFVRVSKFSADQFFSVTLAWTVCKGSHSGMPEIELERDLIFVSSCLLSRHVNTASYTRS